MSREPKEREGKHSLEYSMNSRSPDAAKRLSPRSRSHAEKMPDGKYRCCYCGKLFATLQAADAHHLREHEQQPQMSNAGMPF